MTTQLMASTMNRAVDYTAPCPACGNLCDWTAKTTFDGLNMRAPTHEVRCGCDP